MQERLLANSVVEVVNGREHWVWIGARNKDGYGVMNVWDRNLGKAVSKKAHRVSYETFCGPVPSDMDVDHDKSGCSIRHCINPSCLTLLTVVENRGPHWYGSQRKSRGKT